MREHLSLIRLIPLTLAAVVGFAAPALSDSWPSERVYADSFGNLIVLSSAGYKRIVVGEGRMARQMSGYAPGSEADGNDLGNQYRQDVASGDCYRPAVLLKGRSYMYGLADGELPLLPGGRCP